MHRLTGNDLLERISDFTDCLELESDKKKQDIIKECGYVIESKRGSQKADQTAFYAALLDAENNQECSDFFGRTGIDPDDLYGFIGTVKSLKVSPMLRSLEMGGGECNDETDNLRSDLSSETSSDKMIRSFVRLRAIVKSLGEASRHHEFSGELLSAVRINYFGCGEGGEQEISYLSIRPDLLPKSIHCFGQNLTKEEYEEALRTESWSVTYNMHGYWWRTDSLEESGDGYILIDLPTLVISGIHRQSVRVAIAGSDDDCHFRQLATPYFFSMDDESLLVFNRV